jgi:virginiamycin B lyase
LLGAVAAALALACGLVGRARADVPITIAAFPTPTASAGPESITVGPDGNLWFTEVTANKIGRITPAGVITEFAVPTANAAPNAITAGPDGQLWFTEHGTNDVASISTNGAFGGPYSLSPGSGPAGIASQGGDLWVTEDRTDQIAKVTTAGVVSQNNILQEPEGIAAGSDGRLWFTEPGVNQIGDMTTAGTNSALPVPGGSGLLSHIVSGPDGALWFGEQQASPIVERLTTTAVFSAFPLPASSPVGVEVIGDGPDGQLWMAGGGSLTSLTTAGAFNTFGGVLPSGDTVTGVAGGPIGADDLWLSDGTASVIDRVTLGTAPALAAQLLTPSSVSSSSASVLGTLSVPAGNLPQSASYDFEYGVTTAYGATTTPSTTTATASGTEVGATLSGLLPDTTYHYRVVASGCSPASCQAISGDQSFTTGLSLTPVLGNTVVVAAIRGKVLVRRAGKHRFMKVSGSGELIPVGSTIDARHGHVLIESAVAGVPQQVASGIFYGGIFTATQPVGETVTVLRLDSSFARCPRRAHRATAARATSTHASHKVVNQVFGDAHGRYTTRGHYAAAADEGTGWRIADRCDGTYVAVSAGQVEVTDLVRHRTVALTAGQHYLASAR